MNRNVFDPVQFWRTRLADASAGLDDVGHRAFGAAYNAFLYQRREEAVRDALPTLGIPIASARVLELGCGTGFWVRFWQRQGVGDLVGVDLSSDQIDRLRGHYPTYRFQVGDITALEKATLPHDRFDLVTLFDVLYHIVDDAMASRALHNIASLMERRSKLLVFDQLASRDVSLRSHVKYRSRPTFERLLQHADLRIAAEVPLFAWLAPPVFGKRWVDTAVHAGYAIGGALTRRWPSLGLTLGRAVTRLDRALLAKGRHTPNHHLFVVTRG